MPFTQSTTPSTARRKKRRAFLFFRARRQTDKTLTKNNRQNILQCRKHFRYLCADKKTMTGTMQITDNRQTFADICEQYGITIGAVQKAFVRKYDGGFDRTMEVEEKHWSDLPPLQKIAGVAKVEKEKKATVKTAKPETVNVVVNEPKKAVIQHIQPQPKKQSVEGKMMFIFPLMATVFSVVLTNAGLYKFFGGFGLMLGLMFAAYLLPSVLVARNRMKGDTSENALKTVLWLEVGACVLHFFTFYSCLDGAIEFAYRCAYAFVPAAFVAVISYNAVMIVRDYNAEI